MKLQYLRDIIDRTFYMSEFHPIQASQQQEK